MIRKIKELDTFYLVTIPSTRTYKRLYAFIPEINQIQSIGDESQYVKDSAPVWRPHECGPRTTLDKLPKKWTIPVEITQISLDHVRELYPGCLEFEFSTLMLEDMKIRNKHNWNHLQEQKKKKYGWQ